MARKTSQAVSELYLSLALPAELIPLLEPSLLPGENLREFDVIRRMMIDEIQPKTNVEWLWTLDLVDLSWDILRYRQLKKKVLDAYRGTAIEAILRRLDGKGMPLEAIPIVERRARQAAAEWRDDPEVARNLEARLRRSGFDSCAINAEVFIQARESFEMFDQLIRMAQSRRMALLREISLRREFAKRARCSVRAMEG